MYSEMYNGKCMLRFDDTNPEKSTQEYVEAVHEDVLNYLEIKADKIIFASDHMEKYYSYAQNRV